MEDAMPTIGLYEAKTKLSEIVDRAEKGERFTITRHGKAVAQLGPARRHNPERAAEGFKHLRQVADRVDLSDLTWDDLKQLRDEGKR
jgi:prevent-host-death family protein